MKRCVFAGTFDPVTVGHADMIRQCLTLFDEVVAAILINPDKEPFFTLSEREAMLALAFRGEERVRIRSYGGIVVDLLREEETPFYVRGIRNGADYDYENLTQFINRSLYPELVTLYLPTTQEHLHISSSLVRNCIRFGKPFDAYVPQEVLPYLAACLKERTCSNGK